MTRQRQNSIHTGFELPAKFPHTSVFSSPQPAAWACQALLAVMAKAWERWGCPGAAGEGGKALVPRYLQMEKLKPDIYRGVS